MPIPVEVPREKDKWICEACRVYTWVVAHCCTWRCLGRRYCLDCFQSQAHPCFVEAEEEKRRNA